MRLFWPFLVNEKPGVNTEVAFEVHPLTEVQQMIK